MTKFQISNSKPLPYRQVGIPKFKGYSSKRGKTLNLLFGSLGFW